MTTTAASDRNCGHCGVSGVDTPLFKLQLEYDIVNDRYCRKCLSIVLDNAVEKNRAKQRDK